MCVFDWSNKGCGKSNAVPCEMSKPLACLRGRLTARERPVGCSLGYYTTLSAHIHEEGKWFVRWLRVEHVEKSVNSLGLFEMGGSVSGTSCC